MTGYITRLGFADRESFGLAGSQKSPPCVLSEIVKMQKVRLTIVLFGLGYFIMGTHGFCLGLLNGIS